MKTEKPITGELMNLLGEKIVICNYCDELAISNEHDGVYCPECGEDRFWQFHTIIKMDEREGICGKNGVYNLDQYFQDFMYPYEEYLKNETVDEARIRIMNNTLEERVEDDELIRFNYAGNYIEKKISEVIRLKTEKMAQDVEDTRYYYWYDKKYYSLINSKRDEIREMIAKVEDKEKKDIMLGLIKEDENYYKDCCMLIVGIVNEE